MSLQAPRGFELLAVLANCFLLNGAYRRLCFDLLYLFVHICALSFVLVIIYRPEPASAVTDDFFDDFADVLERTSSFAGCVIVGDYKRSLHLDGATSSHTARFVLLLDSFGLREYVRQPTRGSRQLDVFISRTAGPSRHSRSTPAVWPFACRGILRRGKRTVGAPVLSLAPLLAIIRFLQLHRRLETVAAGARSTI